MGLEGSNRDATCDALFSFEKDTGFEALDGADDAIRLLKMLKETY